MCIQNVETTRVLMYIRNVETSRVLMYIQNVETGLVLLYIQNVHIYTTDKHYIIIHQAESHVKIKFIHSSTITCHTQ